MQLPRQTYTKLIKMNKTYTQIATIPPEEKIVSTTVFGGHSYWSWEYPFYHKTKERYLVATEKAIYEITHT